MANVKVSEKTLGLLKDFKEREQIKTLDGAIRYLLNSYGWLEATSYRRDGKLIPILSIDVAQKLTEYVKEKKNLKT